MSQNYYNLYLESVLELAETLVIKSEYSALRINDYMKIFYGADSFDVNDKHTWKYYLNVSGEYHSKDEQITVVSLDTLQEIVFSKANLQLHPVTAQAYQYGTRYYRELLLRYPEQEQLILGVLYPVDIDTAINADDFTVLSYPKYLVEDNEISLINNINDWLQIFDVRWNNKQFNISDNWYGASVLGVMYLQLVPLILNLRLKACKTSEAHSFHVRQYLASHGMLDVYLSKMTNKQALFFYRNINYIERNSGKQDTFDWLVQKIMTDRNIPLSEYSMHHSTKSMPGQLTPDIYFKKTLINKGTVSSAQEEASYSTETTLKKEDDQAPLNASFRVENLTHIENLFKHSLSSSLPTKMLESSMVDYTDATPITLHQIFLNQWVAFINTNRLNNTYVRIKSPKTSKELLMSSKNAYIYFLYAFAKTAGVTLTNIPPLFAARVQREPTPNEADLLSVVNTDKIDSTFATKLLDLHTNIGGVSTITEFQNVCNSIYRSSMEQLYLVYQQEDITVRGMLYNMTNRLYQDTWYSSFDPITPFTAWLNFNSLEYENFQIHDWEKIYQDIYEQMTGLDISSTAGTVAIQKAMVAMLTQLSSYSIQILSDINNFAINTPNWNSVRLEQLDNIGKVYGAVLLGIFRVMSRTVYPKDKQFIDLENLIRNFVIKNPVFDGGFIDVPIDVKPSITQPKDLGVINLGIFRVNQNSLPLPETFTSWQDYPNYAGYVAMTADQRAAIKNIYCNCIKQVYYPTQADIQDIILYQGLPGMLYQPVAKTYLDFANYYYLPQSSYNFTVKGQEIELDAFYPNFDPEDVESFKLNTTRHTLDNFQLNIDMPIENEMDNYFYTGGWEYIPHFSPYKNGDIEMDIDGFNSISGDYELPTMDVISVSTEINIEGIFTTMNKGMKMIYLNKDLQGLTAKYNSDELSGFTNNIIMVDMSFSSVISDTNLPNLSVIPFSEFELTDAFEAIITEKSLAGLESSTVTHQLTTAFIWNGKVMELKSLRYIDDEENFDDDLEFVQIEDADMDAISLISGYRELKNLKYSDKGSLEIPDPSWDDNDGVVW